MTVINNAPAPTESSNSGMGFLLGIILLIVFVFLLIYYGLPAIQNSFSGGPQINVPGKVDVNVKQQK
jgi:TRAP-type mannitol/chloroaromatic compound transport system permease small subunit